LGFWSGLWLGCGRREKASGSLTCSLLSSISNIAGTSNVLITWNIMRQGQTSLHLLVYVCTNISNHVVLAGWFLFHWLHILSVFVPPQLAQMAATNASEQVLGHDQGGQSSLPSSDFDQKTTQFCHLHSLREAVPRSLGQPLHRHGPREPTFHCKYYMLQWDGAADVGFQGFIHGPRYG
jgi:hypothetical protein